MNDNKFYYVELIYSEKEKGIKSIKDLNIDIFDNASIFSSDYKLRYFTSFQEALYRENEKNKGLIKDSKILISKFEDLISQLFKNISERKFFYDE